MGSEDSELDVLLRDIAAGRPPKMSPERALLVKEAHEANELRKIDPEPIEEWANRIASSVAGADD